MGHCRLYSHPLNLGFYITGFFLLSHCDEYFLYDPVFWYSLSVFFTVFFFKGVIPRSNILNKGYCQIAFQKDSTRFSSPWQYVPCGLPHQKWELLLFKNVLLIGKVKMIVMTSVTITSLSSITAISLLISSYRPFIMQGLHIISFNLCKSCKRRTT